MKTIKKILIALSCIICAVAPLGGIFYAEAKQDQQGQSGDKQKSSVSDEIVASFNNTVIRRSEIDKTVNLYMNMAKTRNMQVPERSKLFLNVLEANIRTKVIKAAAKQAGIDRDKNYHTRLIDLQDQLLIELYLEKELTAKISEPALKSAHKRLAERIAKEKEVRTRHILVREESMAKEIIGKLDKGADFATLADQYNSMAKEKGGDLGYVIAGIMPEPIKNAILELKPGEHTKTAVKSQAGYHIFKVEDIRDAKVPTFEDSKQRLVEVVKQELMEALVKRLVAQSKVKVFAREAAQQQQ
ncbi:MAG: peptidylprolyl isomerase [Holosporales bacterium]|nr:peptidylprolyl isomerase [Holosporales bacterium]